MNVIKFIGLRLHNFKSHRDLNVEFGDLTQITGDNAKGKSSIIEAVPFILYGVDLLGSKTDPTPTNYVYDYVRAELHLSVDGKEILLGRGIEKGKAAYYINEVPSKAKEFEELMKSLFDKDLFLSLFNPSYFFTLNWTEQRALLMHYVPTPSSKEVFAEMSRTSPDQKMKDIALNPQAAKLAELTKKHSLDQLIEIHKKNKNTKDDAYKKAQGRTEALAGQLDQLPLAKEIDATKTATEIAKLDEQIKAIQQNDDKLTKQKIDQLQNQYESYLRSIKQKKLEYTAEKNRTIDDNCSTCGQVLAGEALEKANQSHTQLIKKLEHSINEIIGTETDIKVSLANLIEKFKTSEQDPEQLESLFSKKMELQSALADKEARERLQQQIEQAKADEKATLESRNDSIFILDSIKDYYAKEAELKDAKVQGVCKSISIRLLETQNYGELKNTFEIEKDGKPYRKLSRSEGVHAGLEFREVLSQLSEITAPCAVDDSESVFRIKKTSGQLILVKAVFDEPLKIESEER